jgi:glycosyltransferase involved in cell wall biosynthesis
VSDRGTPIRVSVDVTAVPERPAGGGRYTVELVRSLSARPDVELLLVARRNDAARWREIGGATVLASAPAARPLRLAWEQAVLPRLLSRAGVDVHHGPHYTMPERARVPVVVTVHDCTFFDHPDWHERTKAPFFRRAIRVAARRAAVIVCGSEETAIRLTSLCPVAGPVIVAPYGVDGARFSPEPAADDRAQLAPLGLEGSGPLVVFLGTLEPRKGVVPLVRAFDAVAASHPAARLVLAGQVGWGTEIGQALGAAAHRDRIRTLGYVPEPAIPALLRRATAVAYPSLGEGGGLPALEAIACGAPLVTTSGTPMASTAAGAALLVGPGDVDDLARALESLLSGADPVGVAARRRIGLEAAATRSWAASAAGHMRAYRLASAKH